MANLVKQKSMSHTFCIQFDNERRLILRVNSRRNAESCQNNSNSSSNNNGKTSVIKMNHDALFHTVTRIRGSLSFSFSFPRYRFDCLSVSQCAMACFAYHLIYSMFALNFRWILQLLALLATVYLFICFYNRIPQFCYSIIMNDRTVLFMRA